MSCFYMVLSCYSNGDQESGLTVKGGDLLRRSVAGDSGKIFHK